MKVPPDLRKLIKAAIAAGWTVTRTRSSHLRLRSPSGALVFVGGSPSDWRTPRNTRRDLRRAGLAC